MDLEESATQVIQSMGFIRHPTKLGYWVEPYREVTIRHRNLLRWARESTDLKKRIIDEVGRLLGKRAHDGKHYRRNIDFPESFKSCHIYVPESNTAYTFPTSEEMKIAIMELLADGVEKVIIKLPDKTLEVVWTEIETYEVHNDQEYFWVMSPGEFRQLVTSNMQAADVAAISWFIEFGAPVYYTVVEHDIIYKYALTGGSV